MTYYFISLSKNKNDDIYKSEAQLNRWSEDHDKYYQLSYCIIYFEKIISRVKLQRRRFWMTVIYIHIC